MSSIIIDTINVLDGNYIGKHDLSRVPAGGRIIIADGVHHLCVPRLSGYGDIIICGDLQLQGSISVPMGKLTAHGELTVLPRQDGTQGNIHVAELLSYEAITCNELIVGAELVAHKSITCSKDLCVGTTIRAGLSAYFPEEHVIRCCKLLAGKVMCGNLVTDMDMVQVCRSGLSYVGTLMLEED